MTPFDLLPGDKLRMLDKTKEIFQSNYYKTSLFKNVVVVDRTNYNYNYDEVVVFIKGDNIGVALSKNWFFPIDPDGKFYGKVFDIVELIEEN